MLAGKHKVVCQGQLKTSGDSTGEVEGGRRNGKWRHRVGVFVLVLVLVLVCVCVVAVRDI